MTTPDRKKGRGEPQEERPADEARTPEEEEQRQAAEADDEVPEGGESATVESVPVPDVSFDKLQARARRFDGEQVRSILESLLLVADKALPLEQLERITGIAPEVSLGVLRTMSERFRDGLGGIVLHEVAGGWQLRTSAENAEFVRRLLQVRPQRLTRAALETLAIVAYRQPVTRPEIEDIRAVDCGAVIKALLERKLVKILGKKEEPGHPLLYGTTREFLEFFNLKNLASLPTLREFQELSEESRQIVEELAPEEGAAPISGTVAQLADPAFMEKQRQSEAASEKALDDLELAMSAADEKARETAALLDPPAVPAAEMAPTPAPDEGTPSPGAES